MRLIAILSLAAFVASSAFAQHTPPAGEKPADKPIRSTPPLPAAKPDRDTPLGDKPAAGKGAGAVTAESAKGPLDFTMTDIDGKSVPLSKYRGQVVLIVNTASQCGLTPQYKNLEEVFEKYKDKGLAVLAFPANNFGSQEPGPNDQIKSFCRNDYKVTFDLFSKISVKGDDCCELYKWLTSPDKDGDYGKPIPWNFTKFLVGRDGKVAARFEPKTKPDAAEVIEALEGALKQPAEGAKQREGRPASPAKDAPNSGGEKSKP